MRSSNRLVLAGLVMLGSVLAASSCSEDSDPVDPDPETGSVQTSVTAGGAALSGVTVRLYAPGGTTTALRSGNTGGGGTVRFDDVETGAYEVEVVVPSGFELTAGESARKGVTVATNQTASIAFSVEEIEVPPTQGQIRVRVLDGSAGVASVSVALFEDGGTMAVETGTTGADGRVLFGALEPGAHEVGITVPAGYELATGEASRKDVTVTAGATTDVQFALESTEAQVVEITASGSSFDPATVTISPGTTVRWVTPEGGHTVTPDGHSEWSSANLNAGGSSFEHTFENPGDFDYFCIPHQNLGMTGTVTVQ